MVVLVARERGGDRRAAARGLDARRRCRRHARLLRGRPADRRHRPRAALARPAIRGGGGARLRSDARRSRRQWTARSATSWRARAKIGPRLLIVGAVVGLRGHLRWFDARPLFGRRIVVTRAREQAAELADALEQQGAQAIALPAIRILPPADPATLDAACDAAETFDWLVFTSVNAVRHFMTRLLSRRDIRDLQGPQDLRRRPSDRRRRSRSTACASTLTAADYRSEGIVQALAEIGAVDNARFLVPRSEIARELLVEQLRAAGGQVDGSGGLHDGRRRRRQRAGHLPDAARARDRCGDVHQRVDRPEFRRAARRRAGRRSVSAPRRSRPSGRSPRRRPQQLGIEADRRSRGVTRFRRSWTRSSSFFTARFGACNGTLMTQISYTTRCDRDATRLPGSACATGRGACGALPPSARSFARRGCRADMFVYPLFVCSGEGQRREVPSMPGVYQLSVDEAVREAAAAKADGVPGVLLFGLPDDKDAVGSARYRSGRAGAGGGARHQARSAGAARRHRRVPVRIHVARPLRRPCRRRHRQRRDRRAAGPRRAVARGGGRRHRRAVGHDGRPRRPHP